MYSPANHESAARELPSDSETVQQFRAANYLLRIALDQVSEGVLILHPHGLQGQGPKILFGNARIESMIGVDPMQGVHDRHVTQLAASEQDAKGLLEAFRNAAQGGGVSLWEGELSRMRDAKPMRTTWRIRATHNQHGQIVSFTANVCQTEEPTPVEELSRVIVQQPTVAETPDEAKRLRTENLAAMARGIVHDINNLLGIISGHLSVAVSQTPAHSEVDRHVGEALDATHRARQFTDQILRLTKDLPAKRVPTDLAKLIRDTARVAQSGSGVVIHLTVSPDLWWVVADPAQVSQVLQNLILNGIQAMQGVGHMDVVARNVELVKPNGKLAVGPYVELTVRDRGCGITEENLQRIFQESFTTKHDGNGIGLTTCKRFVNEHGGEIRVSSMVNVGTEFAFYLPSTKKRQQEEERKTRSTLLNGAGTILIVDDESELRRISSTILKHCGYRVFEASSGEEAVRAYQHLRRSGNDVDLVVMDLTLRGGMDGEEAFREIRVIDPDAKVIASSGGLVEETRRLYLNMGFVDILPKPYEASELSVMVHQVLHQYRLRQPALAAALATKNTQQHIASPQLFAAPAAA